MPVYLVERYAARLETADLEHRLAAATAALRSEGADVEWLFSVVLPAEDGCLCLFSAASVGEVTRANDRAAVAFDRIAEAIVLRGAG